MAGFGAKSHAIGTADSRVNADTLCPASDAAAASDATADADTASDATAASDTAAAAAAAAKTLSRAVSPAVALCLFLEGRSLVASDERISRQLGNGFAFVTKPDDNASFFK